MRRHDRWLRWLLPASLALLSALGTQAHAQIYACTAKDGSRVFSDERCGPDAKVVPGIETRKRASTAKGNRPRVPAAPKSPAELEELLKVCNAGEVSACSAWTHGGGPGQLREQERKMELLCEGGSLEDCEQRYCRDGASTECRSRVLQAARLSGTTWYLRRENKDAQNGATQYAIRCIHDGMRETRDVIIDCSASVGPQRCRNAQARAAYARLDQAALDSCRPSEHARSPAPQQAER